MKNGVKDEVDIVHPKPNLSTFNVQYHHQTDRKTSRNDPAPKFERSFVHMNQNNTLTEGKDGQENSNKLVNTFSFISQPSHTSDKSTERDSNDSIVDKNVDQNVIDLLMAGKGIHRNHHQPEQEGHTSELKRNKFGGRSGSISDEGYHSQTARGYAMLEKIINMPQKYQENKSKSLKSSLFKDRFNFHNRHEKDVE